MTRRFEVILTSFSSDKCNGQSKFKITIQRVLSVSGTIHFSQINPLAVYFLQFSLKNATNSMEDLGVANNRFVLDFLFSLLGLDNLVS